MYAGGRDIFFTKLNADGSGLIQSTYFGSSRDDAGFDIAVDSDGNAHIVGEEVTTAGDLDGFMMIVYASGPVAYTHSPIGGSADDWAAGVAVDASGDTYVTGTTSSSDFTTNSPFQAALGGGTCGTDPCPDAFVRIFDAVSGGFTYSTYLGGNSTDHGDSIAVDTMGRIYVAGSTSSTNFPTANAFQTVLKGDPDAFVTRFSTGGSTLDYSTYLGGGGSDYGRDVAVDTAGSAFVVGDTSSQDFPTVNPVQSSLGASSGYNTFATKFNSAGSALAFSSYLGATGDSTDIPDDYGYAVGLDAAGNIYLAGQTSSASFPTVSALQPTYGGAGDGFIAKISPAGLGISPTNLAFGQGVVGGTSSAKVVTLNNAGTSSVSITNIAASGDFQQTNTCGSSIAGGSSCTINVTFTPTATGARTGQLTVTTSVAGSPPPVSLTGTGTDFSVQPSSGSGTPSATVAAGGTATYDLSVVPEGFSGNVAMDCTWNSSQPRATTCSVSPTTVNVNGADPASATVSITTTARSMAPVGWNPKPPAPTSYPVTHLAMWLLGLAALACLALRRRRATVALASVLFMVALWTACGGGSTPTPTPTPTPSGTQAGTYSLTVTGTASGATKSTDITLIVQ